MFPSTHLLIEFGLLTVKGSHAIEGRGILNSPSWVFGAVPGTDPLMAWRTISSKSLGTLRVEKTSRQAKSMDRRVRLDTQAFWAFHSSPRKALACTIMPCATPIYTCQMRKNTMEGRSTSRLNQLQDLVYAGKHTRMPDHSFTTKRRCRGRIIQRAIVCVAILTLQYSSSEN